MTEKKPVIVYGASGYTRPARLRILRELHVPFIAAGRDRARTQAVMDKIPGIETAEYEVAEVEHSIKASPNCSTAPKSSATWSARSANTVRRSPRPASPPDAITRTPRANRIGCSTRKPAGAKVRSQGPAALARRRADVHNRRNRREHLPRDAGGRYARYPGALEGLSTYASTQTIFAILRAKWYYLEQNKLVEWAQNTHFDVNVPGQHAHALVTPWTGTSHPVWFKDDPRVANCKALGGVFAREVMEGFVATQKMFEEQIKPLSPDEQQAALANIAASIQAGMPPRENPPRQHFARLGLRLRPVGARALRDPRRQQLQADRPSAGPCRLFPVAVAAEEGGLRFGLPGLRTP